jgi:large conductance mechanosensitive channel
MPTAEARRHFVLTATVVYFLVILPLNACDRRTEIRGLLANAIEWAHPYERTRSLKGFKAFLLRGNVVELAVAVVIGAAFSKIVDSFVKGVINPVVGAFGTKNLDGYAWCLKNHCTVTAVGEVKSGVAIAWGSVLGSTLTFVMTAAVVYFLLILPMNKLNERRKAGQPVTPEPVSELDVLTEIRDLLARDAATGRGSVPAPADYHAYNKSRQ